MRVSSSARRVRLRRALRIAAALAILTVLLAYATVMWHNEPAWWAAVWTVVAAFLALGALSWLDTNV